MILPAGAPLEPFGRPLRALYVSLNSPVITVEGLPTGPARAAVALHQAGATLSVRCVRTGHVRLFATTEALAGERRVALDAALSFAESMGFLFDEDEVEARGDAGPGAAARLWQELCGEETEPADDGSGDAGAEILLEDLHAQPAPAPRDASDPPPAIAIEVFEAPAPVEAIAVEAVPEPGAIRGPAGPDPADAESDGPSGADPLEEVYAALDLHAEDGPEGAPDPAPSVPPAHVLSKFRRGGPAAAETAGPPDVRLQLVSRF